MLMTSPFNVSLMNVDTFIKEHSVKQVTSPFITAVSEPNKFHPEGLFSEEIFGQVASTDRLQKWGYIDLRTTVLAPHVFFSIERMKRSHVQIMAGIQYAIWDPKERDFVKCESSDAGARTGFGFYLEHLKEISWGDSPSLARRNTVDILKRYKDQMTVTKWPVIPAAIRDMRLEDEKRETDDINKLYTSLINYSMGISAGYGESTLFDPIRYSIQRKLNEIYLYLEGIVTGKTGFLQSKFGARSLVGGTRNVISSSPITAESPLDPRYHKIDEIKTPLEQAIGAFKPCVFNTMKKIFIDPILSTSSDQLDMIDPKTLSLVYRGLTEKTKNRYLTAEGVSGIMKLFCDPEFRFRTFDIQDDKGDWYHLYLVYDMGSEVIYNIRSITTFTTWFKETYNKDPEPSKLRPMTYAEMFYISTYLATIGKHGIVTRYPVLHMGSTYLGKIHVISTDPSRTIKLRVVNTKEEYTVPEYPLIGHAMIGSMLLHPAYLAPLDGDFDGDTASLVGIMSKEANDECASYMKSIQCYIGTNGQLSIGGTTDVIKMTLANLTWRDESRK